MVSLRYRPFRSVICRWNRHRYDDSSAIRQRRSLYGSGAEKISLCEALGVVDKRDVIPGFGKYSGRPW